MAETGHTRARAWWLGLALALLALLATSVPTSTGTGAHAQTRAEDDISRDLEDARSRAGRSQTRLEELSADLAFARDELTRLQRDLDSARAQLRAAEGQLALAEVALTDAEVARDAAVRNLQLSESLLGHAEDQLASEESDLADQVSSIYKYGAAGRGMMYLRVVREAQTPNDVATGLYKLGSVIDYQDRAVDRISVLRDERADLRTAADETRVVMEDRERDAAHTLEIVTKLKDEAASIAVAIAEDEQRQREILAGLEADEEAQQAVLAAVQAEAAALEGELDEARRARAAAGGFACPIIPAWFQNDWGFPRSGGRTHKGTDVFADRGTPIVAVAGGRIKEIDAVDRYRPGTSRGDLGGVSISYWTAPGEYWYFSHLDSIEPGLSEGEVIAAGQVIGYVGNSGNARTTPPHAHVGRYVSGRAINPYPALSAACR